MLYGPTEMTEIMGIGSYVGEIRQGPDGNLYEWVHGVDGLGNPVGFWKKAFKAIKGAATKVVKAGLARLIPGPLKAAARNVCRTVDQIGPAVTAVPAAVPYYTGAKGMCRVLRGAGIAGGGYGLMEVPEGVVAQVPPAARTAARTMCSVINRVGPVMKYIPVAGSYFKKAQGLCTQLRSAGIAGADGPIMEAPDGQLYEVVEGIGAAGQRKRHLRPVRLVIPAYIGPRHAAHAAHAAHATRGVRRGRRRQPVAVAPTAAPMTAPAPAATVHGIGYY